MKMRFKSGCVKTAYVVCCLIALPLTGRAQKGNLPMPSISRPQSAVAPIEDKIANANNRFGFRLFDEILKKDAETNICISPVSIAFALQMTYNGAKGTTQEGMAKALGLQGMSLEDVNQSGHALLSSLTTPKQQAGAKPTAPVSANPAASNSAAVPPQLDIANSLWLRRREDILPDFLQRAQQFYSAQVDGLQDAPQSINAWVDRHTNHKITQIVTGQDVASIEAALINAVYFKGMWQVPFEAKATAEKPFHSANGRSQPCKMMRVNGRFGYSQASNFQMVSLPYTGNRLDMLLLLPSPGTSLNKIVSEATPDNWQKWTTGLFAQPGTVELPRFRAEYGTELNEPLTTLGMGAAFDATANFGGMSRHPLFISKVIHKTFVDVNEQGTEAAAATMVAATRGLMAHPPPPFHVIFDRPFLYAIHDRQTGALLFLGVMAKVGGA